MGVGQIQEPIKIGQLVDTNNKPIKINPDSENISLTFNAVKIKDGEVFYSKIANATTNEEGFIYLNTEEILKVSGVFKTETVAFITSEIFGYEDNISIISKDEFNSKNLKIILANKTYTQQEKVGLIIKNAKALKEKVEKALAERFNLTKEAQ